MPIQITARRDGFRRLGIAHSASTVTYPDDRFSEAEMIILESDPNLIVLRTDGTQTSGNTEELAKANARIAELEAGMTQLSQDADELKSANNALMDLRDEQKRRIDEQQSEITVLTEERDELQAKLAAVASSGKDTAEPTSKDTSASETGKKKG